MQHKNNVIMGRMKMVLKNFSKEISREMPAECSTSGWFALLLSLDFLNVCKKNT